MLEEVITFDPDSDLELLLESATEVHNTDNGAYFDSRKGKGICYKEIRMLVSSKLLIHVSPVFRAMLQHQNFKEGHDLAKGRAEIPLPDDEPAAFQILLDIIHHRNHRVPRKVDLATATRLAILVDKYQCHETVALYSELWYRGLKNTLPQSNTAALLPWLCIAWVFGLPEEFEHLTKIAQRQCSDPLLSISTARYDLPIPIRVLEELECDRSEAIEKAISMITSMIDKYGGSTQCCSTHKFKNHNARHKDACDATVLGSLLKTAGQGILWPAPGFPYSGLSWDTVAAEIRSLEIFSLCDFVEIESYYGDDTKLPANHGIKEKFVATIEAIEKDLVGLRLDSFQNGS